jgi:hypothetical protein
MLIEIKAEYSDILYKPTYFPGLLVWWIRQVPLYMNFLKYSGICAIQHMSFPTSCDIWQKFMVQKYFY